jgi:hypothetical protein
MKKSADTSTQVVRYLLSFATGAPIDMHFSASASLSQPTSTFVSANATSRDMSCEKNDTPPKTLPWTDKLCQIIRKVAERMPLIKDHNNQEQTP